jgi:hypothetical protein
VSDLRYREITGVDPGDPTPPGQRATNLALTPGSTSCTLGEDGIAFNSDGQLLFAEFIFQEIDLEFGDNNCDEVAHFPDESDDVDVQ